MKGLEENLPICPLIYLSVNNFVLGKELAHK